MTGPTTLPTVDEAKALGAKLIEIDPTLVQQPPNITRRWFHGGEAYLEVTVDEDDQGVVTFLEVRVRGRFVRYERQRGLITGATEELTQSRGMPGSKLESNDRTASEESVAVARAILDGHAALHAYKRVLTTKTKGTTK